MYFSPLWNTHKRKVMAAYLSLQTESSLLFYPQKENTKSEVSKTPLTWWCHHTLHILSSCHGPSGRWKRWRTSSPASQSSACHNRVAARRWNSLHTPRRWRTWAHYHIFATAAASEAMMMVWILESFTQCLTTAKQNAAPTCICQNRGSSHLSSVHGNFQTCSALCWVLHTPRNWRRKNNATLYTQSFC